MLARFPHIAAADAKCNCNIPGEKGSPREPACLLTFKIARRRLSPSEPSSCVVCSFSSSWSRLISLGKGTVMSAPASRSMAMLTDVSMPTWAGEVKSRAVSATREKEKERDAFSDCKREQVLVSDVRRAFAHPHCLFPPFFILECRLRQAKFQNSHTKSTHT